MELRGGCGSDLVGVLELEAGDDLTLQLAVGRRLVQDGLAELGDVGFAGFPQHRVQPVVWKQTDTHVRGRTCGPDGADRPDVGPSVYLCSA